MTEMVAAARLCAAWLLWYPDQHLAERLGDIRAAVAELPAATREPLADVVAWLDEVGFTEAQRHYVDTFDMRRRTALYLSYWTDGDTRNRGFSLLRFKQAYLASGFEVGDEELPDHLSVVLEFAALGNRLTGDALLVENRVGIGLMREALAKANSPYARVVDAVLATLPAMTPDIARRMAELARTGPPTETVGLEPFPTAPRPYTTENLLKAGGRS